MVVLDDLSCHYQAYESITGQLQVAKPALVQTHAEIVNHFTVLPQSMGGGSSTALALVDAKEVGDLEPYVEELTTFLDSALYIDSKLSAKGMFPGISLNSIVKSPPSPYQMPMVRGFYSRILSILRQSHRLTQRAEIASELGIDLVEESDRDLVDDLEFPQKFEALINQSTTTSLETTLIALYFAAKTLMIGWNLKEIKRYDVLVNNFLEEERPELLGNWPLDQEIPEFIFDDLDELSKKFARQHLMS
mmetsp:Transcript_11145/g.20453  ORF Transcript_11145/g.20453 Transcript_11145/m.20453 type:complete len:248 (+) Transcript_11145:3-746(+)|eukprot:CAMPEP_0197527752 /NCGR_PEP_ID=MMETSP1318-20131121/22690_1 /TAXON_ID=552666 /ORGANISM="Partenskyella glossopodia, Strain RCC365" /LENGTH=247 /DNA_ID=CAMNT_0043082541 /DNA_START=1 /DNA_END=744 /DNA_ORIENTATION=-